MIKKIVWSVQRDRGLSDLINIWKLKIIPLFPKAELHIFSINPKNIYNIKKIIFSFMEGFQEKN